MRQFLTLATGLAVTLSTAAHAATLDQIRERGSLNACVAMIDEKLVDKSPKNCTEDCGFSGLIIEQVNAFAESLGGLSVSLIEVGWSEQFENESGEVVQSAAYRPRLLADGSCDLFVSNLTVLPWRLRKMNIVPLFQSRMIVMVNAARVGEFADLRALSGQTAAVLQDSSFQSWIDARNQDTFQDNPIAVSPIVLGETFDHVADGTADFAISDADIAVLAMKTRPSDIAPVFAVGDTQDIGWGVSHNAPALAQQVAQFFDASRSDPASQVNLIWQRWFGVTIPEFEALVSALPGDQASKSDP